MEHILILRKLIGGKIAHIQRLVPIFTEGNMVPNPNVYKILKENVVKYKVLKEHIINADDDYLLIIVFLAYLEGTLLSIIFEERFGINEEGNKFGYIMDDDYMPTLNQVKELKTFVIGSSDTSGYKAIGAFLSSHPDAIIELTSKEIYTISISTPDGVAAIMCIHSSFQELKNAILQDFIIRDSDQYLEMRRDKKLTQEFKDILYMSMLYPYLITKLTPMDLLKLTNIRSCLMNYFDNQAELFKEIERDIIEKHMDIGMDLYKYINQLPKGLSQHELLKALNEHRANITARELENRLHLGPDSITIIPLLQRQLGNTKYEEFLEAIRSERPDLATMAIPKATRAPRGQAGTLQSNSEKIKKMKHQNAINKRKKESFIAILGIIISRNENYKYKPVKELATLNVSAVYKSEFQRFEKSGFEFLSLIASIKGDTEEVQSSIKCRYCGKYAVVYTEAQTRSADESMTVFYHCTSCAGRWTG